jgi:uncharacterized membrane protein YbhN (UPF0104 family)
MIERTSAALVAVAVAGAGAVAVVLALAGQWDEARRALAGTEAAWLVAALLLAATAMFAIAWPWADVMAALGSRAPRGRALAWYFVGELGKYVPGGLWTVVGRAEQATTGGLDRSTAYASVALSLVAAYLAAIGVAVALVPVASGGGVPLAVVALLPAGLAVLHPRVLRPLLGLLRRLARRPLGVEAPSWRVSVGLVARYVPAWLVVGGATWCVARALDPGAGVGRVALAAVVSWIVGLLAVPVPGGLGVREAVFVSAAGLPLSTGAATAVVARLAFMLVDAAGALLGAAALRRRAGVVVAADDGARGT